MDTKTQLILLLAGLLGSALKAWASNNQSTLSKKSVIDVIIGGISALLIPIYAPNMLPAGANILSQGAVIVMISYFSSSVIQNILAKIGIQADGGTPPTK